MIPINMVLIEKLEEESTTSSKWIQVYFSALNTPGCQTKWQWNGLMNNRQYRRNSYACNETDHHSYWYCIYCYQCANPMEIIYLFPINTLYADVMTIIKSSQILLMKNIVKIMNIQMKIYILKEAMMNLLFRSTCPVILYSNDPG
jgi:hypothetical protein